MSGSPSFETADGLESGGVRQISVFVENRVGQLMRLFQAVSSAPIRILAMQVNPAVECSIVRLLLDDPETGLAQLARSGFPTTVTELIVVELPPGQALMTVCAALLSAELNIDYAYPLLAQPTGRPALALHCDNHAMAIQVLKSRRFTLLSEADLNPPR